MDAVVVKGGKFTFVANALELSRGLRPSKKTPRNMEYLVECSGAIGDDGVLSVMDEVTRVATDTITDSFPFPQIFVCTNVIIVCGLTKIYEWNGSSLTLKYTATTPGSVWSLVDFFDYVYISNGAEAVVRDAGSKVYAKTTDLPTAHAICNYNGQVLVGAPNVAGLGASLMIPAEEVTVTVTLTPTGEYA